jgi:hypothetical protein
MRSNLKWFLTIGLVALLAVLTACDDDNDDGDSDTGGEATATPSVCDQKEVVEASVQDLGDLDVVAEGTDALNQQVATVKSDVADLRDTVSEDVEPEVEALETAISDAEETMSEITDDSTLNERIDAVQTSITGIVTAAGDLGDSLSNECS